MRNLSRALRICLIALLVLNFVAVPRVKAVAPDTLIIVSPADPSSDRVAAFEFSSDDVNATFECKIDGGAWEACTSPHTVHQLVAGAHVFEVRSVNELAEADQTPATYSWQIDPISVTSCTDLLNVDNNLNDVYVLTTDLDCAANGNDAMVGDNQNPFTGIFDGGEHTITVDLEVSASGVGLFSQVTEGGTVNNLTVAGSVIGQHETGGVVGGVADASFTNIHNTATVVGENNVGGLVGNINGGTSITDSSSSGNVNGDYTVGGLVGYLGSSSVSSSISSGNVAGTADYIGGAFGVISDGSEIVNISASGIVQGVNVVGGFVGGSYCASTHFGNEATGNVVATGSTVGGYVGDDGCEGPGSTYTDTFASGNVSGESNVGGFIGHSFISTLDRVYALGDVTSPLGGYIGGLIGRSTGFNGSETTVSESFAFGDVVANGTSVGGLVGATDGDGNTFTDVFARGSVTGDGVVGGLMGYSTAGTHITNAYATGLISSGDSNVGGLIGAGEGGTVVSSSFWDETTTQMPNGGDGTPKTTDEMINVDTYTLETTVGLAQAWDFVDNPNDDVANDDLWSISPDENNGYPCLTWLSVECNFAGSIPEDLNGDSIPDSEQPNVGGYVSPITGKIVAMDMGENCELTTDDIGEEAMLSKQDQAYEYDNGLFDFAADCTVETTTIKLYYYDVDMQDLIFRKFSTRTESYFTIDDAVIATQTIDGHNVTVVTYQITDNSERDMDLEPGSIEDPAGLARSILAAPVTGLRLGI